MDLCGGEGEDELSEEEGEDDLCEGEERKICAKERKG